MLYVVAHTATLCDAVVATNAAAFVSVHIPYFAIVADSDADDVAPGAVVVVADGSCCVLLRASVSHSYGITRSLGTIILLSHITLVCGLGSLINLII